MLCIPVGIVVERRHAKSKWLDFVWRPVGIFNGSCQADPWTVLSSNAEATLFYAGSAEIELYRSETNNYSSNLASGEPKLWVALHQSGGDPPYRLAGVTADPAEGEALTEAETTVVEAVSMPRTIRRAIAAFIAEHPVKPAFEKRVRDRPDPEAMARHGPNRRQSE
jgi:hypothetical protein